MLSKKLTLLLSSAALLVACGTIYTKLRDEKAMATVKKVAVVAYTANLPASSKIGVSMNSKNMTGSAGGSAFNQTSPSIDQIFYEFVPALKKKTRWAVMDLASMKDHPAYKEAFKSVMEGFHNRVPPASGTSNYVTAKIMDYDGPRILDIPGRDKLMRDLGVDAIVLLRVDVGLKGTAIFGVGSHKPYSTLHVDVFQKGVEKPIWFESFEGKEQESVGATNFFDNAKVEQYALLSARDAYLQLQKESK